MRTTTILNVTVPAMIIAGLVIANCTGEMGTTHPDDPFDNLYDQDWLVGCDPDSTDCIEDYFICVPTDDGGKDCRGGTLPGGDGTNWRCETQGDTVRCWGDRIPDDAEGWICVETEEGEVECERTFFGDGGGDERWICEDEGEFTICYFGDGSEYPDDDDDEDEFPDDGESECPPGIEIPTDEICDDNIDNDCDGDVDENCTDLPEDCICVPGAQRYCDWDPTYCGWGVQTCLEDGLAWGPCMESEPPMACAGLGPIYSRTAEACCIDQGFCCQDFWDLDHDGDANESLGSCVDIVCVPTE